MPLPWLAPLPPHLVSCCSKTYKLSQCVVQVILCRLHPYPAVLVSDTPWDRHMSSDTWFPHKASVCFASHLPLNAASRNMCQWLLNQIVWLDLLQQVHQFGRFHCTDSYLKIIKVVSAQWLPTMFVSWLSMLSENRYKPSSLTQPPEGLSHRLWGSDSRSILQGKLVKPTQQRPRPGQCPSVQLCSGQSFPLLPQATRMNTPVFKEIRIRSKTPQSPSPEEGVSDTCYPVRRSEQDRDAELLD